jgi:hypothetical protein
MLFEQYYLPSGPGLSNFLNMPNFSINYKKFACAFAIGVNFASSGCATPPVSPPQTGASVHAVAPANIAQPESSPVAVAPFPASQYTITAKPEESPVERAVRERAQARWNHLAKAELDEAYEYLSPGSRLASPKQTYKSRIQPGSWQGANVVRVDCAQPERCTVNVNVKIKMLIARVGMINHESVVSEDWLFSGNQWWYVQPAK